MPGGAQAMLPFLDGAFGNPSSYHRLGRQARSAVETGRRSIADIFGCSPAEVVFTAGGTEANNLALRGAAAALKDGGRHIITSAIEHHSVLKTAEALGRDGFAVTFCRLTARAWLIRSGGRSDQARHDPRKRYACQ